MVEASSCVPGLIVNGSYMVKGKMHIHKRLSALPICNPSHTLGVPNVVIWIHFLFPKVHLTVVYVLQHVSRTFSPPERSKFALREDVTEIIDLEQM